jgi:hypothetical protein
MRDEHDRARILHQRSLQRLLGFNLKMIGAFVARQLLAPGNKKPSARALGSTCQMSKQTSVAAGG